MNANGWETVDMPPGFKGRLMGLKRRDYLVRENWMFNVRSTVIIVVEIRAEKNEKKRWSWFVKIRIRVSHTLHQEKLSFETTSVIPPTNYQQTTCLCVRSIHICVFPCVHLGHGGRTGKPKRMWSSRSDEYWIAHGFYNTIDVRL